MAGGGGTSGDETGGTGATSGSTGGDSAGMGGGVVVPECKTHAECLDKNFEPSICMQGSCIPLLSEQCPVVLPVTDDLWKTNLRTQNPIILGAFAQVPASLIGMQTRNYDLALTEVQRKVTGLPGAGGQPRGVVAVVCRTPYNATADIDAGMAHLVDDLHVPGVITALLADDVQHLFETKARDANVMLMSPIESDSTLVTLQDAGLVWQMLPGGAAEAVSYKPLLDRTIAYLISKATLTMEEPVRVAVVVASDVRYLSDMNDTISASIEFNGKTAVQNLSDGNFKSIGIKSIYADKNADLTAQTQAVLDFKPHIIIALAADEFLSKMVPSIESGWAAAAGTQKKPFYLLSAFHFNNPALPALLDTNPTVRTRFAGVNVASAADQTVYNTYEIAFAQAYPETQTGTQQWRGYENFYDAAYYLIYSAAAAGNVQSLTGDDLARGMGRLLSGQRWNVGQKDMPSALQGLQIAQAKISLYGTLGAPNFDPGTGERLGPGSVWCIDTTSKQRADVLRYDEATKTLTGAFPCFTGF